MERSDESIGEGELRRFLTSTVQDHAVPRELLERAVFEWFRWDRSAIEDLTREQQRIICAPIGRPLVAFFCDERVSYLGIPYHLPGGIEHDLPDLGSLDSRFFPGIQSGVSFCQSHGIPVLALFSGDCLCVMVASRADGQPPLGGKALVFSNPEKLLEHFGEVWEYLSPASIGRHLLLSRLIGDRKPSVPPPLSHRVRGYPGTLSSGVTETNLRELSRIYLANLPERPDLEEEFFEECYVLSGDLAHYTKLTAGLLKRRYAALFDSHAGAPATQHTVRTPKELTSGTPAVSGRPILLLGDRGVGKSTFIRYLVLQARRQELTHVLAVTVNLGKDAMFGPLQEYILSSVVEELRKQGHDIEANSFVREVYSTELRDLESGIFGPLKDLNPNAYALKEIELLAELIRNRELHIRRSLSHIVSSSRYQVFVILDDVDQRGDDDQKDVFLWAQQLAAKWPATVYVSLRPETFNWAMKEGTVKAYDAFCFAITPPNIQDVIQRRLQFALDRIDGDLQDQLSRTLFEDNGKDARQEFIYTLRSLKKSAYSTGDVANLFETLSGGDVRESLQWLRDFIGNPSTPRYLRKKIFGSKGDAEIAYTEVIYALLRANATRYYHPNSSPIANVFQIHFGSPREHFLVPMLIGALSTFAPSAIQGGFAPTQELYRRLGTFGFIPEQIDAAIRFSHRYHLIESSGRRKEVLGDEIPEAIRATGRGTYHVSVLCRLFSYVDAIVVDTPVISDHIREAILDVSDLRARLERAERFRLYLDEEWSKFATDTGPGFDWSLASQYLRQDIVRVRREFIEGVESDPYLDFDLG